MGGILHEVTEILASLVDRGGYLESLVCTDDGLLIAACGSAHRRDDLAAFASLFDTVAARARQDLGLAGVDEVTLLDLGGKRLVIRPIPVPGQRMFLVVQMERTASWRRNTTRACEQLSELLAPLSREVAHGERVAL